MPTAGPLGGFCHPDEGGEVACVGSPLLSCPPPFLGAPSPSSERTVRALCRHGYEANADAEDGGGVGAGGWPPLAQPGEDEYTALLRLDDAAGSAGRACPPQVLAMLPTTTVGQGGERGIGADGASSCCICMETIVTGNVVRRLPCCHLFHSRCIDKWLGVKGVCPVDQRAVKDMLGS